MDSFDWRYSKTVQQQRISTSVATARFFAHFLPLLKSILMAEVKSKQHEEETTLVRPHPQDALPLCNSSRSAASHDVADASSASAAAARVRLSFFFSTPAVRRPTSESTDSLELPNSVSGDDGEQAECALSFTFLFTAGAAIAMDEADEAGEAREEGTVDGGRFAAAVAFE